MKILAGALAIGALSWGAANVVSDVPPQIESSTSPAVALEKTPAPRPWAMQPGAFCPMAEKRCALHTHPPVQPSLAERWQPWLETPTRWIARTERQLKSHMGYAQIDSDLRQP
jgi:hypothetical protein